MSRFTTVTASSLGCQMDCDIDTGLKIGGGAATDNTAILNSFLGQASASNPVHLVLDGCTLTTGLVTGASNVLIEGLGPHTGLYMKTGANTHCITTNAPIVAGTVPAQQRHYALKNFRINGNRSQYTTTTGAGNYYFGLILANVAGVRIENVHFYDIPTYSILLDNCSDVVVDGCYIEAPSLAGNTDGVHLNGNCSNVRISNTHFKTGDDAIALNAPEGSQGPITNVAVLNCTFTSATTLLRAYTTSDAVNNFTVSKVTVTNCNGTFGYDSANYLCCAFLLGFNINGTKLIDAIQDFTASNCTISSAGGVLYVGDSCGVVTLDNITWIAPTSAIPWVAFVGQSGISSLNLLNCKTYRTTVGNAAVTGIANATGSALVGGPAATAACSIKKLRVAGFDVDDQQGQAFASMPFLIDTANLTIAELVVDALNTTRIQAMVKP